MDAARVRRTDPAPITQVTETRQIETPTQRVAEIPKSTVAAGVERLQKAEVDDRIPAHRQTIDLGSLKRREAAAQVPEVMAALHEATEITRVVCKVTNREARELGFTAGLPKEYKAQLLEGFFGLSPGTLPYPKAVGKLPLLTIDPEAGRAIMHDRSGTGIELSVEDGYVLFESFDATGNSPQRQRQRIE